MASSWRPKHIVVLMFENRSFDHIFGDYPGVDGLIPSPSEIAAPNGLKPDVWNLPDPTRAPGPDNEKQWPIRITPDIQLQFSPNHGFSDMMSELFGPGCYGVEGGQPLRPGTTYPDRNSGFYATPEYYDAKYPKPDTGPVAMWFYEHKSLKVLHSLADEFVVCDRWFCDAPGDTLLNRYFMHAADGGGYLGAQVPELPRATIFDRIEAQSALGTSGCGVAYDWKIYTPWALTDGALFRNGQVDFRFLNAHVRDSAKAGYTIGEFAQDAAAGTLPFYSFLMCWLPLDLIDARDDISMHPMADIRAGENYLAAVYRTLVKSKCWNDTLLIVTFDENGGFYDHVPPPITTPPNAVQGSSDGDFQFDFSLLGPRVPALLISPMLRKGGIARGQYQNTSILRFLQDLMGGGALTARDATAPKLDSIFDEFGLAAARKDCPASIPNYPDHVYGDGDLTKVWAPPQGRTEKPTYFEEIKRIYGLS